MVIKRLFIANRGEIAVRIIHAAQSLGIHTIQAYSEADNDMLAVKLADEAICIGPAQASESYLNVDAIIAAVKQSACDAVHPGYGFLAENATFVRMIENIGVKFVGPSAEIIERMGDKVAARQVAIAAGVPVVPGSQGRIEDMKQALKVADEIGYPVMIKAAAGGGGRGIRTAANPEELERLAKQAAAEAQVAFGDGGLYLERHIANPRHIEVQILGDGTNFIHCYERECSLQRRRQKLWEEAGANCLDDKTREQLCLAALKLARSVAYEGAGTLEYLYDEKSNEFFFIEMNTRIQVEHPVSEMITGIDLISEALKIAGAAPLSLKQSDIKRCGHSIEVRINAEDPFADFMPFPGKVGAINIPKGEGVRFDHFLQEDYQIPPFYDSLLGKLIVHAADRALAIKKLKAAMSELSIEGVKTTLPLFQSLAENPEIIAGNFHTQWLEAWIDSANLTKEGGMV